RACSPPHPPPDLPPFPTRRSSDLRSTPLASTEVGNPERSATRSGPTPSTPTPSPHCFATPPCVAPTTAPRASTQPFPAASRSSPDRKSTRLNSSHVKISYAVFCLK